MSKGLFTNLYGKSEEGIFGSGLYSRHGSSPRFTSADIRLGGYGEGEDDDDDDDEDLGPIKPPVFAKQVAGFPFWILGVVFLGFSWSLRRRRSKQSQVG
jgi:hypothetical protein